MESQIKYDLEVELSALRDGNIGYVEVRGAKTDLELPFAHPKIHVKYLNGLSSFRISTRGSRDALGR
jgi:hypothetical protein